MKPNQTQQPNPAIIDKAATKIELSRVRRCRKQVADGDTVVATMSEKEQKLWYLLVERRDAAIEKIDLVEDVLNVHFAEHDYGISNEGCCEQFNEDLEIALLKTKGPFTEYKEIYDYFFAHVKLAHPALTFKEVIGVRERERLIWRKNNLYNDVENLLSGISRGLATHVGQMEMLHVLTILADSAK